MTDELTRLLRVADPATDHGDLMDPPGRFDPLRQIVAARRSSRMRRICWRACPTTRRRSVSMCCGSLASVHASSTFTSIGC